MVEETKTAEMGHDNCKRQRAIRGAYLTQQRPVRRIQMRSQLVRPPKSPRRLRMWTDPHHSGQPSNHPSPALWDTEVYSLEKLNPRSWSPDIRRQCEAPC